jgi:hypothetical protein
MIERPCAYEMVSGTELVHAQTGLICELVFPLEQANGDA